MDDILTTKQHSLEIGRMLMSEIVMSTTTRRQGGNNATVVALDIDTPRQGGSRFFAGVLFAAALGIGAWTVLYLTARPFFGS